MTIARNTETIATARQHKEDTDGCRIIKTISAHLTQPKKTENVFRTPPPARENSIAP